VMVLYAAHGRPRDAEYARARRRGRPQVPGGSRALQGQARRGGRDLRAVRRADRERAAQGERATRRSRIPRSTPTGRFKIKWVTQ